MTNDELQAYLKSGSPIMSEVMDPWAREHGVIRRPAPIITCKDGFQMSVQASATHYCEPRDNFGPYTEVEVGFPSEVEDILMAYAENNEAYTDTVYPYTPIEIVLAVINKHGGVT